MKDSMREFRKNLYKMLAAAYREHDIHSMTCTDQAVMVRMRLDTIKEIAKLAGVHRTERQRCALNSCGSVLELGDMYRYCSNACKQKAYRIRHGQMRP